MKRTTRIEIPEVKTLLRAMERTEAKAHEVVGDRFQVNIEDEGLEEALKELADLDGLEGILVIAPSAYHDRATWGKAFGIAKFLQSRATDTLHRRLKQMTMATVPETTLVTDFEAVRNMNPDKALQFLYTAKWGESSTQYLVSTQILESKSRDELRELVPEAFTRLMMEYGGDLRSVEQGTGSAIVATMARLRDYVDTKKHDLPSGHTIIITDPFISPWYKMIAAHTAYSNIVATIASKSPENDLTISFRSYLNFIAGHELMQALQNMIRALDMVVIIVPSDTKDPLVRVGSSLISSGNPVLVVHPDTVTVEGIPESDLMDDTHSDEYDHVLREIEDLAREIRESVDRLGRENPDLVEQAKKLVESLRKSDHEDNENNEEDNGSNDHDVN